MSSHEKEDHKKDDKKKEDCKNKCCHLNKCLVNKKCGSKPGPVMTGTWTPLNNQPYNLFSLLITNQQLLTDGSIFVQSLVDLTGTIVNQAWRLTPDIFGSYVNGTWSQLASLPDDINPVYCAAAVMPDSRLILCGGEYNATPSTQTFDSGYWNYCLIYDVNANNWTQFNPPSWFRFDTIIRNTLTMLGSNVIDNPIGDASSVVLADGTLC
jgi:hypothetical protein